MHFFDQKFAKARRQSVADVAIKRATEIPSGMGYFTENCHKSLSPVPSGYITERKRVI